MIKSEMSQILSIQPGRSSRRTEGLFEPREFNLTTDLKKYPSASDASEIPEIKFEEENSDQSSGPVLKYIFPVACASVLLIIIGGLFYFKNRI